MNDKSKNNYFVQCFYFALAIVFELYFVKIQNIETLISLTFSMAYTRLFVDFMIILCYFCQNVNKSFETKEECTIWRYSHTTFL